MYMNQIKARQSYDKHVAWLEMETITEKKKRAHLGWDKLNSSKLMPLHVEKNTWRCDGHLHVS